MKLRVPILCSLCLCLTACGAPKELRTQSQRIDDLFAKYEAGKQPGAAVMVIQNEQVLHEKGYGYADLKNDVLIDGNSNFRLASLSKQFTAMAIMLLSDEKLLSLDDRLAEICPEFEFDGGNDISIRHLLNHTSGLPNYEELFVKSKVANGSWPRSTNAEPNLVELTAQDVLKLLAAQKSLRFQPGERFEYSNAGYVVLARVIEKVSGMAYGQFIATRVFKPLGMTASRVSAGRPGEVEHFATSYEFKNGEFRDMDCTPFSRIYGDKGVFSSLEDLKKWLRVLDNEHLVKHETMLQALAPGRLNDGKFTNYGFGFFVENRMGQPTVGHNGFWGGFRTSCIAYGTGRFWVIILSNRSDLDTSTLSDEIAGMYLFK